MFQEPLYRMQRFNSQLPQALAAAGVAGDQGLLAVLFEGGFPAHGEERFGGGKVGAFVAEGAGHAAAASGHYIQLQTEGFEYLLPLAA